MLCTLTATSAETGRPSNPIQGGQVSWSSAPKAIPNGWYWMYDDTEASPPFEKPVLQDMPPAPYSDYTIHDTAAANRLAPYNDEPFLYALPDSFWYYGYWIQPGTNLFISPDGWISFDNASEEGFPDPPSASPPFPNIAVPNMVIAPLWADYDPTRTPGEEDNNRVYYLYHSDWNTLIVEWYRVQGRSSGNEYTFLLMLHLGGQSFLEEYSGCGVVFSHHFIHFMYNTASAGWDADGGVTGFEDPDGVEGITYLGTINTSGDDFMAIRAGYKRIFKHDVAAYAVLAPRSMVLRYTPIEPEVVVANLGEETEHFTATLKILRHSDNEIVYEHALGVFDLLPNEMDTLMGPCWEPGEMTEEYYMRLYVELDRDECQDNNHNQQEFYVGCEDTLKYMFIFPNDVVIPAYFTNNHQLGVFFEADGGILLSGAHVQSTGSGPWIGAVWEAQNGCGLPVDPPLETADPEPDTLYSPVWKRFMFKGGGLFVPAATPGNIWVGVIPASSNNAADLGVSITGEITRFGLRFTPPTHPCYTGPTGSRSGFRNYGAWAWEYSGPPSGPFPWYFDSIILNLFSHLGFGDYPLPRRPGPPCWEGGLHDVSCLRMEEPNIDFVEAGDPITPELAVSNLGYQAEPDSGFIPVKFFAVSFDVVDSLGYPDTIFADTAFADTTMLDAVGWLGDPVDDPDTVYVPITQWTPEGKCSEESSIAYYELIGLVRLGKIGPDSSDHCPNNDTVRRYVTCLLSHNVGVTNVDIAPSPDQPPDWYAPETPITITATVENFGFYAEHDVEVRCEVRDVDSVDVLVWHALAEIEFIDWRGNQLDRPYTTQVVFPAFTRDNRHHMTITCHTEMPGDECPDDDFEVRHINAAIAESDPGAPFALEVIAPNPFAGTATISYAVPYDVDVSVRIYDVSGKLVRTLVSCGQSAGRHSVTWHGVDDAGRKIAAGIYLIRMQAGEFEAVRKILILN
jgi:hypothetical protein